MVVNLSRVIQNNLFSSLILIAAMVFSTLSVAKSLTASVDRQTVSLLESFTLQLKAEGISHASEPDFSSLTANFDILGKNVSQSMRNINGVSSQSFTWTLKLQAKNIGKVSIPAFSLSGLKSKAIEIAVNQAVAAESDENGFSLHLSANKSSAVPNEQIIVTLKFSFSRSVSNLQSTEVALENAQVLRLDDKSYEYSENGKGFAAYEISYAVFASAPGVLEIPAQQISVRLGRSSMFNSRTGEAVLLQSEPLNIPISALDNNTDGQVLVADSLNLQEQWLQKTDTIELGASLTREVSLLITGALAETIPSLQMSEIDNIKIYPEPAQKSEQKTSNGMVAKRSRSFAIIPTAIGEYTLPAIEIVWWNALEKKLMTALIPEKHLKVVAAANSPKSRPAEPDNQIEGNQKSAVEEVVKFEKVTVVNPVNQWLIGFNVLLLLALALLSLTLYKKSKKASSTGVEQGVTDEAEAELFSILIAAVKSGSEADIYRALMRWSQHINIRVWQVPGLEDNVRQLESWLYSNDDPAKVWQKSAFSNQLKQQRKHYLAAIKQDGAGSRPGPVASLYPVDKSVGV